MMRADGPILCFGELLLRLSPPGHGPLFRESRLDANFGGAEANVAVALARLGRSSGVISAVPDDVVGDAAIDALRRSGVDVSRIARGDGRLGLYYLAPGAGLRASAIVYDRQNSVFATRAATAYDWPALLAGAARLHLSGINPAIGSAMADICLAAMTAARAIGVPVSFDGNYRASMWAKWCADPAEILLPLIDCADLLFGNYRDIALLLRRPLDGSTPKGRRDAALAAFDRFPNLRHIASMSREVRDAGCNVLRARIDTPTEIIETDAIEVSGIVDRIGTGDAFAAGVLAELGEGAELAAQTGLALAVLKHATPGDQSETTPRDLATFREGGFDVRR
ncbi:sugar kinase [Sphingomonas sp. PP-F2F-A104-K0414]|uniref:sugar kinase n=1 Tax=Sphingomonas sp. PP-F2F-A104-K0414 TaxID=2135661 RepID=UPI0032607199